jgi:hypothetical protein
VYYKSLEYDPGFDWMVKRSFVMGKVQESSKSEYHNHIVGKGRMMSGDTPQSKGKKQQLFRGPFQQERNSRDQKFGDLPFFFFFTTDMASGYLMRVFWGPKKHSKCMTHNDKRNRKGKYAHL